MIKHICEVPALSNKSRGVHIEFTLASTKAYQTNFDLDMVSKTHRTTEKIMPPTVKEWRSRGYANAATYLEWSVLKKQFATKLFTLC